MLFKRSLLVSLYLIKGLSVADIARKFSVSENNVNYWLAKYNIKKRSIADALYLKHNPNGDPFIAPNPKTNFEWYLYGLGVGIYWGEGNKRSKNSLRVGNTDPYLIKTFILFLERLCGAKKTDLRFGLQIFSDIKPSIAQAFWVDALGVARNQFQKIIITPARNVGTYKYKSEYGVLTVYFNNTKLQAKMREIIENLRLV